MLLADLRFQLVRGQKLRGKTTGAETFMDQLLQPVFTPGNRFTLALMPLIFTLWLFAAVWSADILKETLWAL